MGAAATDSVWAVIPVYNNGATVQAVAEGCRRHLEHVLVVDDGCSDVDVAALFAGSDIEVLTHAQNRGKGAALISALAYVRERGGKWMVCLDADAQHSPEDLPVFLSAIDRHPTAIIVGARDFSVPNVPGGSRFGRKFSNFWVKLESGKSISDTQSGYRAYPVELVSQMKFRGRRYDFEVEVLTKAVWYGLDVIDVPIHVYYPPKEERISHFDQLKDNARLTHRHGMLVSRRLLPWPHPKLVKGNGLEFNDLMRHPRRFLLLLLKENATPVELGLSAGVGILLATLPLIGCHTIAILYVTTRLSLNRLLAVTIQNLCNPPLVPVVCIELGFFLRNGRLLSATEGFHTIGSHLHQYLFDWLLGSLVLAPLFAAVIGFVVFWIAASVQQRRRARQYA